MSVKFEVCSFNHFGWHLTSKFRGRVTLTTPPFEKIFWGHVRIVPENMCVKFEVCSFNHFEAIGI